MAATRAAGDTRGEGYVFNCIGGACTELRRFDQAVAAYQQALELFSATGNAIGAALVRRNLGYVHTCRGRPDLSPPYLLQALATSRELDNPRIEEVPSSLLTPSMPTARTHPSTAATGTTPVAPTSATVARPSTRRTPAPATPAPSSTPARFSRARIGSQV